LAVSIGITGAVAAADAGALVDGGGGADAGAGLLAGSGVDVGGAVRAGSGVAVADGGSGVATALEGSGVDNELGAELIGARAEAGATDEGGGVLETRSASSFRLGLF
jgi:hypothetical protein